MSKRSKKLTCLVYYLNIEIRKELHRSKKIFLTPDTHFYSSVIYGIARISLAKHLLWFGCLYFNGPFDKDLVPAHDDNERWWKVKRWYVVGTNGSLKSST